MGRINLYFVIVFIFLFQDCQSVRSVFDQNLYEEVLDPVLCAQQLNFLASNGTIFRLWCMFSYYYKHFNNSNI